MLLFVCLSIFLVVSLCVLMSVCLPVSGCLSLSLSLSLKMRSLTCTWIRVIKSGGHWLIWANLTNKSRHVISKCEGKRMSHDMYTKPSNQIYGPLADFGKSHKRFQTCHKAVQCNAINAMQCSAMQCNQCNATQCNATQKQNRSWCCCRCSWWCLTCWIVRARTAWFA